MISIVLYYTSRVAHTSPPHMHEDSGTSCIGVHCLLIKRPGAGMSPGDVCGGHVTWCTLLQCLDRLAYCHSYVISLPPPLHVVSTNSEAKRRQTGTSVYICSVIYISVSVCVSGHVIMCTNLTFMFNGF